MDGNRFDELSRQVATEISRRKAVKVIAAGVAGALGFRGAAAAQVNQEFCGNQFCAADPGSCKPGCVCCTYYNAVVGRIINSRCRPPGLCNPNDVLCPPGTVYDPARGCVTPTGTTTAAPTTTTTTTATSTTARPTTTTTTTSTTTTSTVAPTTTTPPPCPGGCPPDQICCNGTCQACCDDSQCEDIDICHTGRCQGGVCISAEVVCDLPDDFIDCTDQVCDVALCGCVHKPFHDFCPPTTACNEGFCDTEIARGCTTRPFTCPDHEFDCVRSVCDPSTGCYFLEDDSLCPPSDNFCTKSICSASQGCILVPMQPRECPIPIEATQCYDTFCDPVTQSCVSVPNHSECPASLDKYNCEVPFCYGGINGGCGFKSLCETPFQNGCGAIDQDHGCICTAAFVTGGSCVTSGPQ